MSDPQNPTTGVPTCYRHPGRESYIHCQRCDRVICPDCMNDASVGFQCPHCIAEGAKSTRSARTAYGGLRPTNASITSGVIIAINVAVWLAIVSTGGNASSVLDQLALRPLEACFGDGTGAVQCFPGVANGAVWQLFTSAFTHVSLFHIGFNMFALWSLGPQLEMAVGRTRFLALYLLSALAGSTAVYFLSGEYGATVGASGAIFGLMGALLVIAHKVGGNVQSILTWIGINFVITLVGRGFISWQGHLGGFIGGLVIAAILVYAPRGPRRTTVQALGVGGLTLALIAALVVRTTMLV